MCERTRPIEPIVIPIPLSPQELLKEAQERRAQVDSLNEVSSSLLELVPWRVREGLDKLVSEDNERYKMAADAAAQHVRQIDAAILKSQQVTVGPERNRAPSPLLRPGSR